MEGDVFAGLSSRGVLLFSKKGDSYRFVFTDQAGNTRLLPASYALPCFKAEIEESAQPISDDFYALYEKAKADLDKVVSDNNQADTQTKGFLRALWRFITGKDA